MPSLRSSLVITFFASNGSTVVGFMLSLILARLLSPTEIGIFSIAAVLVAIAQLFRDFGVASYLIREKDLSPQKIRSASGVLYATSWGTALVLYFLSSPAAEYYGRIEIKNVIEVLALGFIFIPFGSVTHALLTRDLRAKEQAIASMVTLSIYFPLTILIAYSGAGYMTMAWANLINITVLALALLPFRPKNSPWLPSLKGWRNVVSFGSGALFSNSIQAVNNSIPDLVLGKISGPHDVGIYSRSASTTNIFGQIFGPSVSYAVLPVLAKKYHAGESLAPPLAKGCSYFSLLSWFAFIATAVFAKEIILVLYGEKWLECVPAVQVLCLAAALGAPFNFNNAALLAINRPYLSSLPGISGLIAKLLLIALLFDGSLLSFAYAMLAASAANLPVHLWLQTKFLGFEITNFFKSLAKSFYASALFFVFIIFLKHGIASAAPSIQLLILFITSLGIFIFNSRILMHPIVEEFKLISIRFPILAPLLHGRTSK